MLPSRYLNPVCPIRRSAARAGLLALAMAVAVSGEAAQSIATPLPVIVSATPDFLTETLTIRGVNFGTGMPRVTLNSAELVILTYGADQLGFLSLGKPNARITLKYSDDSICGLCEGEVHFPRVSSGDTRQLCVQSSVEPNVLPRQTRGPPLNGKYP